MSSKQTSGRANRICREYAQGQCHRSFCRYPHVTSPDQVVFCHDFQNSICPRTNCKFLHVPVETEEHYRLYGKYPDVSAEAPQECCARPNSPHPPTAYLASPPSYYDTKVPAHGTPFDVVPPPPPKPWPQHSVDWRHLNQSPPRGAVSPQHLYHPGAPGAQPQQHPALQPQPQPPQPHHHHAVDAGNRRTTPPNVVQQQQLLQHRQQQFQQIQQHQHIQQQQQHFLDSYRGGVAPLPATSPHPAPSHHSKRPLDLGTAAAAANGEPPSTASSPTKRYRSRPGTAVSSAPAPATGGRHAPYAFGPASTDPAAGFFSDVMAILRRFEEEHNKLRSRVEAAELKIEELSAANEYLLSQNAQYRMTAEAAAAAVQRGMTTATVTTVSQPQATMSMLNAVSIAPVQLQTATPIVSMAGPQIIASTAGPQIIASTSSGMPLSISANTTQGQQIAALAHQSLNTLSTTAHQVALNASAQLLGTSQITLTPTLTNAPSIELTLNTSQALACVSNATQPIISYPVMTHSILPH